MVSKLDYLRYEVLRLPDLSPKNASYLETCVEGPYLREKEQQEPPAVGVTIYSMISPQVSSSMTPSTRGK